VSSRVKEAVMTNDPKAVALAYIEGCSRKDFDRVAELLAPDIRFEGPGNTVTGAPPYLAVLRRIATIWVRSDVRKVFVDGSDVCVIYDFVTDSPAGAVPTVEWLHVDGGRVASVHLFFDRVSFKPASEEAARRAAK
jgi:ketosteroid isomerase-like protein